MSVLDNVDLATIGERRSTYDPVQVRRRKLAAGLLDQIKLIDAIGQGETHKKSRVRKLTVQGTNDVVTAHDARSVSPWWSIDADGKVHFAIRYGAVRLKLRGTNDTVVCNSLDDLRQILPPLRQETLTGSFDATLAAAAAELQTRFKPKKSAKAK
ncbi:hypothetical protein [Brevundimonas variabilis]|uniref:Uncharacterized protein n=1 Tax=Brevundimonas variabilis TaxID=74312 RepID=A0A7W9CGV3_9CAUL|nr:hypothetical protein [Brevundimonas variabilis]MBB5745173.1 hypothetical protein [Brevundimonas variabilis]